MLKIFIAFLVSFTIFFNFRILVCFFFMISYLFVDVSFCSFLVAKTADVLQVLMAARAIIFLSGKVFLFFVCRESSCRGDPSECNVRHAGTLSGSRAGSWTMGALAMEVALVSEVCPCADLPWNQGLDLWGFPQRFRLSTITQALDLRER